MKELHRKFDSLAGYITFMEVLDSKFHHHLFWLFKFAGVEAGQKCPQNPKKCIINTFSNNNDNLCPLRINYVTNTEE